MKPTQLLLATLSMSALSSCAALPNPGIGRRFALDADSDYVIPKRLSGPPREEKRSALDADSDYVIPKRVSGPPHEEKRSVPDADSANVVPVDAQTT